MWELDFISEEDFKSHVRNTIQHYGEKTAPLLWHFICLVLRHTEGFRIHTLAKGYDLQY